LAVKRACFYAFLAPKTKKRPLRPLFDVCAPLEQSTALFRTLARVLFAAGGCTALKAHLLAMARAGGIAFWWDGLGGADVGFDSDFFRHEGLQMKID
jgi:hypothetical protein